MKYITQEQLNKLKTDAVETLRGINKDVLTKESFILIGVSMAILNYGNIDTLTVQECNAESIALIELAKKELEAAEFWLRYYRDTQDRDFIQMAYDRSTHGDKLIKMSEAEGYDATKQQAWLVDLQERIERLSN